MKLKLQFDQKAIQEFLLENVEKIGFGIVTCIVVAMVYSAVRRVDRYQKTPDQLVQAVKQGQKVIDDTPANAALVAMVREKVPDLTVEEYEKKYEEGYGKE